MDVSAKITGIRYSSFLCRDLNTFAIESLGVALTKEASCILNIGKRG